MLSLNVIMSHFGKEEDIEDYHRRACLPNNFKPLKTLLYCIKL